MADSKPPTGVEKSASAKVLKESSKDDDDASGKNLTRNDSATDEAMSPLNTGNKKDSSGGSAIKRTRSNPRRGSEQQSQNSRGSGSRIAKIPRDPKQEKVSLDLDNIGVWFV